MTIMVALILLIASAAPTRADGSVWFESDITPSNWQSLAHDGSIFVAVSSQGAVATSTDGIEWITRTASDVRTWQSVTYGDGLFVAVSSDGGAGGDANKRVMTSPDGIVWTTRTASAARAWQSVTYGGGLFVAVSSDGASGGNADKRVMTSPDGIVWTTRAASAENSWRSVAYGSGSPTAGGGLFVAVSSDGTGRVMTSADGTSWTTRTAAAENSWRSVTYGDGVFVAVASDGADRVMTSTDGTSWTARTAAEGSSVQWQSVTFGDGVFVAVGSNNTPAARVMRSTDGGTTWASPTLVNSDTWRTVGFGGGTFVALGHAGKVSYSRLEAAMDPTFDVPVRTADGFTVNITNYDPSFVWPTQTVDAGTVTAGTPSGATLGLSVTGLAPDESATITATTTRDGYTAGSASVTGQALGAGLDTDAGLAPTVEAPMSVSCSPAPQVNVTLTCTMDGGSPGSDIVWEASYNPVFSTGVLTLDGSGAGSFSFRIPSETMGSMVGMQLVGHTGVIPLGMVSTVVPTAVSAGGGSSPIVRTNLLGAVIALLAGIGARRRSSWPQDPGPTSSHPAWTLRPMGSPVAVPAVTAGTTTIAYLKVDTLVSNS